MARIFLLHWNATEAKERALALISAGHDVHVHWSAESSASLKKALPDIAVISLDRLPSHGRAVAEWLWEAKKRQHIPIIFAGGEPAKVAAIRIKFPNARYCATAAVVQELAILARSCPSAVGSAPTRRARPEGKSKSRPGAARG